MLHLYKSWRGCCRSNAAIVEVLDYDDGVEEPIVTAAGPVELEDSGDMDGQPPSLARLMSNFATSNLRPR